jgi:stage III sporulation protein AH
VLSSIVLRRQALLRFGLFVLLAAALTVYVGLKRAKMEEGSALEPPQAEEESLEDAAETMLLAPKADFFSDSRLERERAASRETEVLQAIAADPGSDTQVREEAERRLMKITRDLRLETQIEGLLRSKGFEDALAFITAEGVIITVMAESLEPKQVAQVADIAMNCLGIGAEQVNIIARPE